MIIVFVDIGLLAIGYLILFLCGGAVMQGIASILLGPVRFLIYALFITLLFFLIKKAYLEESSGNLPSKALGTVLTTVGCIMRHGVILLVLFTMLLDFSEDFDNGLVGMINGTLGFFFGGMVIVLLICGAAMIDAVLGDWQKNISPILIGIINVIVSFIVMIIIQAIFLQGREMRILVDISPFMYNVLTGTWFCQSDFAEWIIDTFF